MPEQSHAIDHNGGHTLLPAYFGEFGLEKARGTPVSS